ncbi:MAG TPA: PIN domain-containing protein [Microthrixaceae bacterium]|nr:PIN domain-containing protein [Microthrixaceae bacterium]
MIVDANILLYAVDDRSPWHAMAREWMETHLNGHQRVGLPWESLGAFVRISTNPRAVSDPLTPQEAWDHVTRWLDAPAAWVPERGTSFGAILGRLVLTHDLRGPLISDAMLAALCLEHGVPIVSADSDFARFTELTWIDPLS